LFHYYQGFLQVIYACAMVVLFAHISGDEMAERRWPAFLFLLVFAHSALARWLSCLVFGLDYPWYLQSGVAGQYVLGPMFQPSVFGVGLIFAVFFLFLRGRHFPAAVTIALTATIHSTYLLPGALLTAGFLTALLLDGKVRRAAALGAFTLAL